MKTLYLYRHAKSCWADPQLTDIDRPLNPRGQRDAKSMALRMKERGVVVDELVCSPAIRCRLTLEPLLAKIGYPPEQVDFDQDIYEAPLAHMMLCLHRRLARSQSVMLLGHNPSLLALANYLAGPRLQHLPTAGLIRLDLPLEKWSHAQTECAKWVFVESPKRLSLEHQNDWASPMRSPQVRPKSN